MPEVVHLAAPKLWELKTIPLMAKQIRDVIDHRMHIGIKTDNFISLVSQSTEHKSQQQIS